MHLSEEILTGLSWLYGNNKIHKIIPPVPLKLIIQINNTAIVWPE